MALKTNYKDALWDGDRLYQVTDAGSGKSAIKDVTVYTQIGDSFGAKDINDTNTEVNKLSEDMVSLKKSVSDGKTLVAAAITAKKVVTAATASFAEMAENIKKIVLGSGTARAADVLAGKTFTNNDGVEYTGSMPERGTWNGSLGTSGAVTIPSGHHSGSGKVSAQTQTAMTLNPGTTQKTAYVYQKYMLGNITVPAINIPAAYIKKGQRITFPDGSSVVGTFEGYVANANDLYYRGIYNNPVNLENSHMEFRSDCIAFPSISTYYLHFTNPVNLSAYSKLIVEDARSGVFTTDYIGRQRLYVGSSVKPTTVKSVPTSISGKSLVFDISSLQGSQYIRLGLYGASDAQIIRIRLE